MGIYCLSTSIYFAYDKRRTPVALATLPDELFLGDGAERSHDLMIRSGLDALQCASLAASLRDDSVCYSCAADRRQESVTLLSVQFAQHREGLALLRGESHPVSFPC